MISNFNSSRSVPQKNRSTWMRCFLLKEPSPVRTCFSVFLAGGSLAVTSSSPQMEWTFLSPADSEPTVFPDQGSLSSHRQHGDGTYSLSSHLTLPPSLPPGTMITCRASHPVLDSPLSVSLLLETPPQGLLWLGFGVLEFDDVWWVTSCILSVSSCTDSYWWVFGFLVITGLFFYQVMK